MSNLVNTATAAKLMELTPYKVRALCRSKALLGAYKDPKSNHWKIPLHSIEDWIKTEFSKKHKESMVDSKQDRNKSNIVHEKLFYYFWLPAGKDAFGFTEWDEALLNVTGRIKKKGELPISRHIQKKIKDLERDGKSIGGVIFHEELFVKPGELFLRKIQTPFTFYLEKNHSIELFREKDKLEGLFSVYSNGLYIWQFDIEYDANEFATSDVGKDIEHFLNNDFTNRHLHQLLDLSWYKSFVPHETRIDQEVDLLSDYQGILNYYQLEILFNGIFNINVVPSLFFGEDEPDESDIKKFCLENVIRSISLYHWQGKYAPVGIKRKEYSYEENGKNDALIQIPNLANVKTSNKEQTALFLSRVTYSAMEQFIRVSNTFGLLPYNEGLEFCAKRLLRFSFSTKMDKGTGQIFPVSLREIQATITQLESYIALIVGKIPTLLYIHELIDDLANVTKPLSIDKAESNQNAIGITEWKYSRSTLNEAIKQLKRKVIIIESNVHSIEQTLKAERENRIIYELTESRKINEIVAEQGQPFSVTLGVDSSKIERLLAAVAVLIALISILVDIGLVLINIWVENNNTAKAVVTNYGIIIWFSVAIGAIGLLSLWNKQKFKNIRIPYLSNMIALMPHFSKLDHDEESERPNESELSSRIFDYASVRIQMNVNSSAALRSRISKWIEDYMPSILHPDNRQARLKCERFDSFTEVPTVGVVKYKYSLKSAPEREKPVFYLLHIEVDHNLTSDELFLTDVRLVIKHLVSDTTDYANNAQSIIRQFVFDDLLGLTSTQERAFNLEMQFGW